MFKALKKYISRELIFPKVEILSSNELHGTVAIVSGASRGIGKAVTEMILKGGGKVVAVSRDIEQLRAAFPGLDAALLLCEGDVSHERDVQTIVDAAIHHFGPINTLVNNAGINIEKPLEDTSSEEFDDLFDTNVRSAFLLSKYVVPHMKKISDGIIINIGSKISHNTNVSPNKTLYATTKYAIEGFSFALNRELKPWGIRVSCLMPGTVNTFISAGAKSFLSPYHVAEMVSFMIKCKDIDFEGVIMKATKHNI